MINRIDKELVLDLIEDTKKDINSKAFETADYEIQYLVKRRLSLLENYLWNESDIANKFAELIEEKK